MFLWRFKENSNFYSPACWIKFNSFFFTAQVDCHHLSLLHVFVFKTKETEQKNKLFKFLLVEKRKNNERNSKNHGETKSNARQFVIQESQGQPHCGLENDINMIISSNMCAVFPNRVCLILLLVIQLMTSQWCRFSRRGPRCVSPRPLNDSVIITSLLSVSR